MAQVDAFLDDPTRKSGAFVLVGEVGVGKTTFLAHLVHQRNYLHLFGEQVPGDANLPHALRSLMAQLITRYQIEPYTPRHELPGSLPSDSMALERLLYLATSHLKPGERIVIVCDALNEVGTVAGGNVLRQDYLSMIAEQPDVAWWLQVHQCSASDFVQMLTECTVVRGQALIARGTPLDSRKRRSSNARGA